MEPLTVTDRLDLADESLTNLADDADLGDTFLALADIARTAIDAARQIANREEGPA